MTTRTVFHVSHEYEHWGRDDPKIVGMYASRDEADAAIRRMRKLPGFRDWPDGFVVDEYEIGKDHWADGFREVVPIHVPFRDGDGDRFACVHSVWIPGDLFRIVGTVDTPHLVFTAGQVVRCEERTIDGIAGCFVAMEAVDSAAQRMEEARPRHSSASERGAPKRRVGD